MTATSFVNFTQKLLQIGNMSNRTILTATLAVLLIGQAAFAGHPNVVVFVADDLGAFDLGYTGSTFYESPNIDALAKKGMVFTRGYAACPVCSPTRAALMTGKYPPRTGVTDYLGGPQPDVAATQPKYRDRVLPAPYRKYLKLEERTIGEAMKDAGYATMFFGKWHLGREPYYPDKQGFDYTLGAGQWGSPGKDGYFSPYNVSVPPGPKGEHLDLRLASEAAKKIASRDREKPFLLWMSFYDVHVPLMAREAAVKHFEEKRNSLKLDDQFGKEGASQVRLTQSHAIYAAMIKTMDDAVGTIVHELESQKLLDNTIILFTSDNGGLSTAEGSPTTNLPLRTGKGWSYEGGTRVPLFAIVPGITRAGSHSDVPASSIDFLPTILAACGFADQTPKDLDGISLLPALKGEPIPARPLFWHYPHYGNQGGSPFSSIIDGDWKLIAFHDARQGTELYNLQADPSEKQNLAKDQPEKMKSLRAKLDEWKKSVGAIDASAKEK